MAGHSAVFAQAIAPTKLDSHTYAANLSGAFLTGGIPHGGYLGRYTAHLHSLLADLHTLARVDFL